MSNLTIVASGPPPESALDKPDAPRLIGAEPGDSLHPELTTWAQLNRMSLTKPSVLVDGLIRVHERERIIVHGPPAASKSWVALLTAVLAAHNGHRVLLFFGEGHHFAWRERLRLIAEGQHIDVQTVEERIAFGPTSIDLDSDDGMKTAASLTEAFEPKIVIVDPMTSYFSGDENSVKDARPFLRNLNKWPAYNGISLILVQHDNKGSANGGAPTVRGTSALRAWTDSMYHVTAKDGVRQIVHEKCRDDELRAPLSFTLVVTEVRASFDLVEAPPNRGRPRISERADEVERLLRAKGPQSKTRLRDQLGMSTTQIQQALELCMQSGRAHVEKLRMPWATGNRKVDVWVAGPKPDIEEATHAAGRESRTKAKAKSGSRSSIGKRPQKHGQTDADGQPDKVSGWDRVASGTDTPPLLRGVSVPMEERGT